MNSSSFATLQWREEAGFSVTLDRLMQATCGCANLHGSSQVGGAYPASESCSHFRRNSDGLLHLWLIVSLAFSASCRPGHDSLSVLAFAPISLSCTNTLSRSYMVFRLRKVLSDVALAFLYC